MSDAGSGAAEIARTLRPVTDATFGIFRDLAGPAAKEIGEWTADLVRMRRQRLQVLEGMLADEMKRRGIVARAVDPELLLAVCEIACRVRDDELSEVWARLLAGAVESGAARHPMWIDALRRMTGAEVRSLRGFLAAWPQRLPADDAPALRLLALQLIEPAYVTMTLGDMTPNDARASWLGWELWSAVRRADEVPVPPTPEEFVARGRSRSSDAPAPADTSPA